MCKWCTEHGRGRKWYLELKNYQDEVIREDPHYKEFLKEFFASIEQNVAVGLKNLILGLGDVQSSATSRKAIETYWTTRYSVQVVSLKDAFGVIDNASNLAMVPCACRRMFRGMPDERTCMGIGVALEIMKEWPDYTRGDIDYVSKEEAKEITKKADADGYVHNIGAVGPYIFILCQCEYPTCIAFKLRRQYELDFLVRKGHEVAAVDLKKCNGCGKCLKRCPFGAITFSPILNQVVIDGKQCFGCGLCSSPCESRAIALISRESFPTLREEW
jgi:NAD-dependent dihydropyrimidine dehydrogenase PreA subunit